MRPWPYTGPDCKRCRREKTKLFLKGAKCDSPKCPIEIRPYPPGEHGRGRTKDSEYLLQMREKQKCARIYGVLEKQFRGYYEEASGKSAVPARTCCASSRAGSTTSSTVRALRPVRDQARQFVRHGHFLVNGHRVDIPSYRVSESDIVEVAEKSRELDPFIIARAVAGDKPAPAWLEVMPSRLRVLVHSLPVRQVIDTQVQEQLIVEFYSK